MTDERFSDEPGKNSPFRVGTGHVLASEFVSAGLPGVVERRIEVITKIASVEQPHPTFLDSEPVALAVKLFTPAIRRKVESSLRSTSITAKFGAAGRP